MWEWIKWQFKIGWVLYMQHVGAEYVTEFWRQKKTGKCQSRVLRWQPRKVGK